MIYECCDPRRLRAVAQAGALNGIAWLEVSDDGAPSEELRQRTLFVRLLLPPPGGAAALTPDNVRITGGERIPTVGVEWVAPADALPALPAAEAAALLDGLDDPATTLVVRTADRGDFSTYTLSLVTGPTDASPPGGFDQRLAAVDFSFKIDCDTDFDCAPADECGPGPLEVPTIDYTARDYSTFRRLLLDRLDLVSPDWRERNPAEAGVALVEVLAYLADELSYRIDAATTEGYLATARRRPSLRRLARLVDYTVHEGCNARAWVRVLVDAQNVPVPSDLVLLTGVPGAAGRIEPDSAEHREALSAGPQVFAPVADLGGQLLHQSVEELDFHTWGDEDCCLPAGATSATLVGHHATELVPGSVVVLAEVAGPATGTAADADPAKRVAVRLTAVEDTEDLSGGLFKDVPDASAVPVTEIEWHREDALPFGLCISDARRPGTAMSRVWGNIVLADHGRVVEEPAFATVPAPALRLAPVGGGEHCDPRDRRPVPARFRPVLGRGPLTHAAPSPAALAAASPAGPTGPVLPSASAVMATDARTARPAVRLDGELDGVVEGWEPLGDLLDADGDDTCFVVEPEHDGTANLRFGDGAHGRRPATGTTFDATYRIGNGTAGNVGRDALVHAVTSDTSVAGVSNPLPATGGVDPEPADAVRRDAPEAFLVQQRAVTEGDYGEVAERHADVQRAAATFRWTGSWHTVFVTADRIGGGAVGPELSEELRDHLEPFRMAGYDLEVDAPQFVPLEVELRVCAAPDHFRSAVRRAVADVLTSGYRADGRRGLFHPDNFSFGQPVHLSTVVAAAQGVEGVDSVEALVFRRQRSDDDTALDTGVLEMGRLEVARLDNDPNFPERGTLTLDVRGGK